MASQQVDQATLAVLVKELYNALKTYCPCSVVRGVREKGFCNKCRTGNALKKAREILNEKD